MSDHPDHDERLRTLLDDAVSDVEPRPGLESIRARTKVTTMSSTRSWILAAAGAVAATAATVVAVVVISDDDPNAAAPEPAATATQSPDGASGTPEETPTEPEGRMQTLAVYYVGETPTGPRLFREFRRVAAGESDRARVEAALGASIEGRALDPDYRSDWPTGTSVTGVRLDGPAGDEVVEIDLAGAGTLHDRPAGLSQAQASMAIEQLIYTAQAALQRRAPVQFLLDGQRTDTVLGVPTSEPLAQGEPMRVRGTVWVITPQNGDEVTSPVQVEGVGAFFEANVSWQLLQDGKVVKEGFTTAEEGMTLSPYSFTVKAQPGDYVLRVYDADMSDGEGPGEVEDTKQITIR